MVKCSACGNNVVIVNGKCKFCGTSTSAEKAIAPRANQVSGRTDEKAFRCISCGSFNVHFCNIESSLRCRSCKGLLTYEEAVNW
jgi:hypothetical protein